MERGARRAAARSKRPGGYTGGAAVRRGVPAGLMVPALAGVAFLLLPLVGVLARTDWPSLAGHLTSPQVTEALRLSLVVSGWALLLSLVMGVPLAWLLARVPFPGKALVRSLVLLPMVLPPTVGGVALLLAFGRRGVLGPWLESAFGLTLPFHTAGAVVAAAFVAMPFLVISLEGALAGLRPSLEETAASLGAGPLRVFATVTLPLLAPALAAGAALTWARALGEFGATITFAGNLPGATQTLPLQVYLLLQDSPEAATSVSLLLLVIAMAVLVALRGRWTGGAVREARTAPPEGASAGPAGLPDPADGALAPDEGAPASGAASARPAREDSDLRAELTGYTRFPLTAPAGTTLAVVGPNGAGKTTLLRALLGLTPRAHAEVRLGGRDVTRLPAHRRQVAWVPQDGALFPHLSALSNTAYGLRARGVPRAEARLRAQQWLERLGVGELADRRPAQLSGGQAQRVALARALAARPRLLLLDEPLAALDQTTRARVRHTLRRHLAGFGGVCLIVTHDPVEAVSLADRVLVLEGGDAVQDAPPAEVTRHPRSPWVARMLGGNAWEGTAGPGGTVELAGGGLLMTAPGGELPPKPGAPVLAVIAPEAVSLHLARPEGSPRNVWPGTVRELTAVGSRLRVLITSPEVPALVAEITPAAAADLGLTDGSRVWTAVKATEVTVVGL
ncbi:ABC transporter permease [Streptomyces diastaticus]|uniref:Molybdenum transport system permease protein ModB n=3 Tax=Streptomyces TaxID=1883 RepID=A0A380P075_STRGR|nr:molybdate transport system permease protein [Streptomyces sp. DSM 41037]SUP58019.1 Molybdenum transport system permease protein ModB [Streptomyces griseus]